MFDSALKQVQNVRKVHVKRSADSDAQADDGRRKKAPYPIESSAGSTASTRPPNWGQYQFMTTTGVIHPTRPSSLSTGADASRSQYPGGGADDFMDETPYLAPEDEDLGMQAENATPSRLSAIAEVPTPVATPGPIGHAVFGQSLSGASFGFQSSTDMWQGPPRYPQGVSAGSGFQLPTHRTQLAQAQDQQVPSLPQTVQQTLGEVTQPEQGERRKGRPKKPVKLPPVVVELDFFVKEKDGNGWREPLSLNEDIQHLMKEHIHEMVDDKKHKDTYRGAVNRGERESTILFTRASVVKSTIATASCARRSRRPRLHAISVAKLASARAAS
jgi:hypothetical protein